MRRSLLTLATALTLAWARDARADDGPFSAMKNILHDSPTLGIVTGSVVIIADIATTTASTVLASQGRTPEDGLLWTQLSIASPQAVGFAMAPFFFDIHNWSPQENIGLVVPFQAWSAALTTHAIWSLGGGGLSPSARLGVSFLIGGDYALTATAIGCASRGNWAPMEVAIVEMGYGALASAFAIERAVTDVDHRIEWSLLAGWSGLVLGHGIGSVASGGASHPRSDSDGSTAIAPFLAPTREGVIVGAGGVF